MSTVPSHHCRTVVRTLAGLLLFLGYNANLNQTASAYAQSAPAGHNSILPQFEVASITRTPPNARFVNTLLIYPGGRVEARGVTLEFLLMEAFNLQPFQIKGTPAWAKETRFDIEAKPPASIAAGYTSSPNPKSPPSEEQREMLQGLLINRFQLQSHLSKGLGLVYILTKTNKPLGLTTPKDSKEFHWAGNATESGLPDGDGLRGTNISMPELAQRLSQWLSHPVEDHTGITGNFDFITRTGDVEPQPSPEDIESSILSSLKSLGLELKKSRCPVPQLVIDHISPPSAN